jgi:hypothetical protein
MELPKTSAIHDEILEITHKELLPATSTCSNNIQSVCTYRESIFSNSYKLVSCLYYSYVAILDSYQNYLVAKGGWPVTG